MSETKTEEFWKRFEDRLPANGEEIWVTMPEFRSVVAAEFHMSSMARYGLTASWDQDDYFADDTIDMRDVEFWAPRSPPPYPDVPPLSDPVKAVPLDEIGARRGYRDDTPGWIKGTLQSGDRQAVGNDAPAPAESHEGA